MESGLNVHLHSNVFAFPQETFEKLEREIQYLPTSATQIYRDGCLRGLSRDIAAFGDLDVQYTFSGLTLTPKPWTPLLHEIKTTVETLSGLEFNFVLVNRYQDGMASMGKHKDIDDNLNGPICFLNFGETRTLLFKKSDSTEQRIKLKDNTLLVMKDPTNTLWSRGIPPENNATGIHVNLTFYNLVKTHSKRKQDDKTDTPTKRTMNCLPSHSAAFEVLPDNMFALGDDVFIMIQHALRCPLIHIRRYKKYGSTYYPTKEGATLLSYWIEEVMGRKNIPQTKRELNDILYLDECELQITSENFSEFTLTRFKRTMNGHILGSSSITLSTSQWNEMIRQYADICMKVLDYQYSSARLHHFYSMMNKDKIPLSLPSSLDNSLGAKHLLNVLKNTFSDLLKENGLKEPETRAEEVWANHTDTFNAAALYLDVIDVVVSFDKRLWNDERSLQMKPAMYLSQEFFQNVKLDEIVRELRNKFCPPDAFMYFE